MKAAKSVILGRKDGGKYKIDIKFVKAADYFKRGVIKHYLGRKTEEDVVNPAGNCRQRRIDTAERFV